MNSGTLSLVGGQPGESFQQQWLQWRALLARCSRKPSRKRVHDLRVATLRLQALLEFWLQKHAHDPAANAVKRWNRQANKLRHSLQCARSAEVYSRKLAWLSKQEVAGSGKGPVLSADCRRQVAKLERRFAEQRKRAEKKLVEEIGSRCAQLERWGKKIENAIASPTERNAVRGDEVVREQAARLKDEFPVLAVDCLHEYRKRVKNMHYLAEFFADGDPRSAQQAKVLSSMQAAIGEWRDWNLLTQEARSVLKDKESELHGLLAEQEEKSLRKALRWCRRLMARLLKDEERKAGGVLQKIPTQRVETLFAAKKRRHA